MNIFNAFARGRATLSCCLGFLGGAVGSVASEGFATSPTTSHGVLILHTALWLGLIGAGILLALMWSQAIYLRHNRVSLINNFKYVSVGFICGVLGGVVAQGIYGSLTITSVAMDFAVKPLCWAVAGSCLGFMLSPRIPNLSRVKGAIAGAIGGYVGGLAFMLLSMVILEALGRTIGAGLVGAGLGLSLLVADTIAREAWLEVSWSPQEITKVSLGATEVSIGGDYSDTIYAKNTNKRAIVIAFINGQVSCLETQSSKRTPFRDGSKILIGGITILTRVKGS